MAHELKDKYIECKQQLENAQAHFLEYKTNQEFSNKSNDQRIQQLEKKNVKYKSIITKLKDDISGLRSMRYEEEKQELKKLKLRYDNYETHIGILEVELIRLQHCENNYNTDRIQLTKEIEELKGTCTQYETRLNSLETELSEYTDEIAEIEELKRRCVQYEARVNSLGAELLQHRIHSDINSNINNNEHSTYSADIKDEIAEIEELKMICGQYETRVNGPEVELLQHGINSTCNNTTSTDTKDEIESIDDTKDDLVNICVTECIKNEVYNGNRDAINSTDNIEDIKDTKDSNRLLCVICLDKIKAYMVSPCNHICLCDDCIVGTKSCPMCRGNIGLIVKVFI